jgi:hypothetical protein
LYQIEEESVSDNFDTRRNPIKHSWAEIKKEIPSSLLLVSEENSR